jgi:tetratricopeptide (TPR) repeat protein
MYLDMKLIYISLLVALIAACTPLSEPRLLPMAASVQETRLLNEGQKLYEQGKYSEALRKAEQATKINPSNTEALFAQASCLFMLKKYKQSINVIQRGTQYYSKQLPDFYLLLGANYESLDAPWDALRTYRFAIQQYPDNSVMHFRLAMTYLVVDKPEQAAESLKTTLRLDPHEVTAHFRLGMLYAEHGYRIPALLALSTSLLLEPENGPVAIAHDRIIQLLAGSSADDSLATAKLSMAKTDEGDFSTVGRALKANSDRLLKHHIKPDSAAMIRSQYQMLFKEVSRIKSTGKKYFVSDFYIPFYQMLSRKGLSDAAINWIFQTSEDKSFNQWIKANPRQTKRLTGTINDYKW